MQQLFWKLVSKKGKSNLLRAQIRKGYITINLNGNPILNQRFSGAKNMFSIMISENTYTIYLQNKPVGGYDYTLLDPSGNEIKAIDINPTIAVTEEAERIADYADEINAVESTVLFPQFRSSAISWKQSMTRRDQRSRERRRKKQKIKELGNVCPYCGIQLPDSMKKCFHCGKEFF